MDIEPKINNFGLKKDISMKTTMNRKDRDRDRDRD